MVTFLLIIIITLLIINYTKKCFYFYNRGIRSPIPIIYLGLSYDFFFGKDLTKFNLKMRQKFGKIYGMWFEKTPVIVIGDEKIARIITQKEAMNFSETQIIKDFNVKYFDNSFIMKKGIEWKNKRALVSPIFTTKKIKNIFNTIQSATAPLFENIESLIKEGKNNEIEIKDLLKGYSLDVIARYVFALELNSAKDKDHPFVKAVRKFTKFGNAFRFMLLSLIPSRISKLLNIEFFDTKSMDYVAEIARNLVKERQNGENYNDFLSMYLETVKEKNLPINTEEIVSNCILFLFAALETVSTTICNVLYDLILNPEYQDKLYNELINLYQNKEIEYDNLNDSKLLDAIIKESQRLSPILTMVFRVAEKAIEIEGFKIEANDRIAIDIMSFHRSPEYWPDEPDKFKPERFFNNDKSNFDNFLEIMPFGIGPRSCVAARFATVQLKYTLAKLILNYEIYKTEKTDFPPKYIKLPNQLIYDKMYIGLKRRNN